jgi:hypothetical protein
MLLCEKTVFLLSVILFYLYSKCKNNKVFYFLFFLWFLSKKCQCFLFHFLFFLDVFVSFASVLLQISMFHLEANQANKQLFSIQAKKVLLQFRFLLLQSENERRTLVTTTQFLALTRSLKIYVFNVQSKFSMSSMQIKGGK